MECLCVPVQAGGLSVPWGDIPTSASLCLELGWDRGSLQDHPAAPCPEPALCPDPGTPNVPPFICAAVAHPWDTTLSLLSLLWAPHRAGAALSQAPSPHPHAPVFPSCLLSSRSGFGAGEHKLYFCCALWISCCLMILHSRWCPDLPEEQV